MDLKLNPHNSVRWRVKLSRSEARNAYIVEGTLPDNADENLVALRVYMEDPHSLLKLVEFARKKGGLDYILCWLEIQGFRMIPVGNTYQLSTANKIYHKYVKRGAVVTLVSLVEAIDPSIQECICQLITTAERKEMSMLPSTLFDFYGHECLRQINEQLFKPFKSTINYAWSIIALRNEFNNVAVNDFEYMELLGQGGFGFVVHCKKKSTGKHYAMKIQSKSRLLEMYPDCPKRVTIERDALVKCHHPFIISMDYAFQTADFAVLVTALGSGMCAGVCLFLGNCFTWSSWCFLFHIVGKSLKASGKISEERVVFYTAEIILALNHIHEMGMIYRDLKPANILLNADGHIQLVDMGGVVDTVGNGLNSMHRSNDSSSGEDSSNLFSRTIVFTPTEEIHSKGQVVSDVGTKAADRAHTIMGTSGFMAPEVGIVVFVHSCVVCHCG